MFLMPKTIISDTSCFIILSNIGELDLLQKVYGHIITTQLGLNFTGTIGVIIKAKLNGVIPSIKPLLLKIRETDFRLTSELELFALREAGE